MILTGRQQHGLEEVMCHPHPLMQQVELRINGLEPTVREMGTSPDEVRRSLVARGVPVTERMCVALEAAIMLWDIEAAPDVDVTLQWSMDGFVRDTETEKCRQGVAEGAGALVSGSIVVRADNGMRAGLLVTAGEIRTLETRLDSGLLLRVRTEFRGSARLIVYAGNDSAEFQRSVGVLERKGVAGIRRQRIEHAASLADHGTAIEAPDERFVQAFEWARVRADSSILEIPGIGRTVLSEPGVAPSDPSHAMAVETASRSTSCWTAIGQLAVGDRGPARDALKFLARAYGAREVVSAGEAALTRSEAGPEDVDRVALFLLLAGRYAAWTGDAEFLERIWPVVDHAVTIVSNYSTWTRQQDASITTLYSAAIRGAALDGIRAIAESIGLPVRADEVAVKVALERTSLRSSFLHAQEDEIRRAAGGRLRSSATLLSIPILLGQVTAEDAAPWLDTVAGAGIDSPVGTGLVSATESRDEPGIRGGRTIRVPAGCIGLAECVAGRVGSAFARLLANLGKGSDWPTDSGELEWESRTSGAANDESLDRAWNSSILLPLVVEGIWGVVPDAINAGVRLAPYLPQAWNRMALRRLRVGLTTLDAEITRGPGRTNVRIERTRGPHIQLILEPRGLTRPSTVTLDDHTLGSTRVVFEVEYRHEVTFYE